MYLYMYTGPCKKSCKFVDNTEQFNIHKILSYFREIKLAIKRYAYILEGKNPEYVNSIFCQTGHPMCITPYADP